ncbi:hypothetical protein [Salinivirga cyanobacteriivorans]|nr:hypothetical protein [Salinivirga cyanobacteriivorans]
MFQYKPDDVFIPLTSTMGVQYQPFLSLAVFAKVFFGIRIRRGRIRNQFYQFYPPFYYYLFFLLIIGAFFGHNDLSLYWTFHGIPHFLVLLAIPIMFSDLELKRFNKTILYFTIFHTIIAFAELIFRGSVMSFFQGRENATGIAFGEDVVRIVGGIGLSIYSLIISAYYLVQRNKQFSPLLLFLVLVLSWFFIWQSATRGWMIASTFFITSFFLFYSKRVFSARNTTITLGLIVFLLVLIPPNLRQNFQGAVNRLATLEALAEGDVTAEGTLSRITERTPRVLNQFYNSPIFGFGFSKETRSVYDPHVAIPSLLLIGGILGLLVYIVTFFRIVLYLYKKDRYKEFKGIFIFGFAIIAFLIINASSRKMVGYHMVADAAFMVALFFAHFNALVHNLEKH